MRPVIAFVLSLLTLVGGHCFNRRWDRVIVFATLALVVLPLLTLGSFHFFFDSPYGEHVLGWDSAFWNFNLAIAGLLFLVSAVFAAVDSRRDNGMPKNGVQVMVAGVVLSLTCFTMGISYLSMARLMDGGLDSTMAHNASSERSIMSRYNFMHRLSFSRNMSYDGERPLGGSGQVVGQVLHDGEPAANVYLSLGLNGKYRVDALETDEAGRFSVSTEPGRWHVDGVHTEGWANKPDGEFMLFSEYEPAMQLPYTERPDVPRNGVPVDVVAGDNQPQFTLHVRPAVALVWPTDSEDPVTADPERDQVQWEPPAEAVQHVLEIGRGVQRSNFMTFRSIVSRQLGQTSTFPLSDLQLVPFDGEAETYRVRIASFDADGELISRTASRGDQARFVLPGYRIADDGLEDASNEIFMERHRSDQRIKAAGILIDEKMFTEAEELLQRTDPQHVSAGRHSFMFGRLSAAQNLCDEAKRWFEQATQENSELTISPCANPCPD